MLADIPVSSWVPVGAGLLLLALLGAAAAVFLVRRAAARVLLALVAVVLVLASAAVGVNAYFGYYPTLGEALGGAQPDEDSLSAAEAQAADGAIPATGQVVPIDLPGTTSGFAARQAYAYLPPAWSARPRPALPVVLLLHGTPGDPTNWTEGGAAQSTADAWAAAHGGTAPVLVMPDINGALAADSECVDGPVGRVETYLTVDVPAAVQQNFGTAAPGPGWAVAGLSEGGSCAIMLALRHPDLFTAFGDFGGLAGPRVGETNADTADTVAQLFGGSQQQFAAHEPATLLGNTRFPGMGGWFQVGTDDAEPLAAAQQLVPLATAAGVSTCLVTMPGQGHTFDVWSAAFRDSLPWLAARLGLVPADPSQTSLCAPS
ncbi:alpha/beta hydrolase [Pseudonocardia saturnea]